MVFIRMMDCVSSFVPLCWVFLIKTSRSLYRYGFASRRRLCSSGTTAREILEIDRPTDFFGMDRGCSSPNTWSRLSSSSSSLDSSDVRVRSLGRVVIGRCRHCDWGRRCNRCDIDSASRREAVVFKYRKTLRIRSVAMSSYSGHDVDVAIEAWRKDGVKSTDLDGRTLTLNILVWLVQILTTKKLLRKHRNWTTPPRAIPIMIGHH